MCRLCSLSRPLKVRQRNVLEKGLADQDQSVALALVLLKDRDGMEQKNIDKRHIPILLFVFLKL